MSDTFDVPRMRSDSMSTMTSQSTSARFILRQRLAQLLTCLEDLSSDDEANEEVSRTLDEAFNLCGRYSNRESFRLHMVTWNVGTAEPPADVRSLLQLDSQPTTDLYVIGLQEVNATPVRYISDLIVEDTWSHLLMETLAPEGYIKVTSVRMQGLLLILFAKQVHLPFIRDIQSTYTRTGLFGYWGNKGGISVRFSFYGEMLCFLNCHLAAHMNYALQRMDEFEYILDTQEFDMFNTPQVLDHKVVFWFGDLNFRIADHGMHFLRSSINNSRFNLLWDRDQLSMLKKKEPILQEFEEGPLRFKPTYKFDRFSETYDTSGKKRKPAWTDRILWRIKPKATEIEDEKSSTASSADDDEFSVKVTQDMYTCDVSYGVSDHKPVIGTFNLEMRKKVETPLVALTVEGIWSADEDAIFTYTILENFESSTFDWIGLYKIGFKSASDYSTFAWVKDDEVAANGEVVMVQMNKNELPLLAGDYVLGYFSTNMQTLIAFSPNFQILESKRAVMEGLVQENINGLEK
ncbi:inositol polyphosphate 5-phosphatase K isoform X2 [Danio rerio]|uniref:Inositol polyphosphate 5-phosphatase K isoform X2 n=1 Tax=Danio rerio TaxID=7955 RepID=A0A8M2B205_DANRE|nr:inositol polyphosphate 5-phosphatase K isoform X1 [Danio rerio]|eukprot:XP_005155333.2 inositol polyphosphate 5-phosphatase K isoform X1 [Danio rerio]